MRRFIVVAIAATLAVGLAPAAWAGGWATVGLSSLPDGVQPGEPWTVELTILQHGVTPLQGVRPEVVVWPDRAGGDAERRTFPARPTGEPGVYRARVVFPAAGRWDYQVDDGFLPTPHSFAAVDVGGASAAPPPDEAASGTAPSDEGPWTAIAVAGAALAALAAAGGIALGARRRGGRPLSGRPA